MSFGKLYTRDGNPRSIAIRAVAQANKLDIEEVEEDIRKGPLSTEYLKINKLGRIPSFVGADGYELTECIAIAIYITSQNEKTSLLGKTKQDYASIVRWMSLANSEILPCVGAYFRPILGQDPYNKRNVDEALKSTNKIAKVLDEHLLVHTFLVGERITLADLFTAGILSRGYQYIFDKQWREDHPNVTRWYDTVKNQPMYSSVAPKIDYIDEALKNQAPKKDKEEKPKQEKAPKAAAAPKPKAKEVDEEEEEEEEAKPAPKPKHPLEALPKPTLVLDDWKRTYSNEETPVALKWFWENYNPEEYSLWKVDYKYNEELTQTFMTSNLIGGFFARLEASRKYIFGCASVYGKSNDSVIQGAFVIRGQEALPAFDVAPDYESYDFTKLDSSKSEEKSFLENMWLWEDGVKVNGKEYPWADGKVFK
ncbi:uncharacterized protein KY384_003746 [Bacidia gigantensis]|uniref:uncharacterized protein n=1 Tax=Bacidia gigantensis TaxID=2732470 RepID=UPI001D0375A6|nr:uncharacterized protein KY384_003746 [Bacidia gigantensis]KAG8532109.1 hypothetical protein KY384_003746 [Bacidia gigantensis]